MNQTRIGLAIETTVNENGEGYMSDKYYRYEYQPHEYFNQQGSLYLMTFTVVRRTPKGAWVIAQPYGFKERFILDSARKKYCYPDHNQALTSFIARKRRYISILKHNLENAEHALKLGLEKRNA